MAIKLEYYKVTPYKKERSYDCPYNSECRCEKMRCSTCGWNPTVAQARLDKIIKERSL